MRRSKPLKITSRVSSVTNGFVQAIIPRTEPCPHVTRQVLDILSMQPTDLECAYCGQGARHWDHLNPLVSQKRPTGYLNSAENRVPACDACNTSKGGKPWKEWMLGPAKGSPTSRGVSDVEKRIALLEKVEAKFRLQPVDLENLAGAEIWRRYWDMRQEIEDRMFEAQRLADEINECVTARLVQRASQP